MIKKPPRKNISLVIASCPSYWFIRRLEPTRGDCRQFHLNLRSTERVAIA